MIESQKLAIPQEVRTVQITPEIAELMEAAISAIHAAHLEYCMSSDHCTCCAEAKKIADIFGLRQD